MKLKFLGSGCWQGVPGQFCDDKISKNVKWGSKDFRFRTSLHIETDNGKSIIIETTPDIRLQAWKFKLKSPDVFLVSHWHWDHLFGINDLDWYFEKNKPVIYGSKETKEFCEKHMSYIPVDFRILEPYASLVIDNLKITSFEVFHIQGTQGYILENMSTKKKIAYLSDLYGLPQKSLDLVNLCDFAIVDSSYIGGEGIDGDKTHFWKEELLKFLESLKTKKIVLTHINSMYNLSHSDLQRLYPAYKIAYDGLEIKF